MHQFTLYGVRYTEPFLVPLSKSVLLVTSLKDSSTFLQSLRTLRRKHLFLDTLLLQFAI